MTACTIPSHHKVQWNTGESMCATCWIDEIAKQLKGEEMKQHGATIDKIAKEREMEDDLAVCLRKIADAMTTTYIAIEPNKYVNVQENIRLAADALDRLRGKLS